MPLQDCIKPSSQKKPIFMFIEMSLKIGFDKLEGHSLLVELMYLPLSLNGVICAY